MRLPSAGVGGRVATVLTWLSLACCEGMTPEVCLRATSTFNETMCLLVLHKVHNGISFRTAEDSSVVVHHVPVVTWRESWS